ncbi:MAG: ATP-binding cassette domain-containing protein [Clostridia bacterium]|nr:ATP-binding cassette domain-containing protein [Clostridia bacterium]
MAMIELKNINKSYKDKSVYSDFNFNIESNKITAILGESGSGKTTLLNMIAGITDYTGEIKNKPKKVSFVFQNAVLIPSLTVLENIKLVVPDISDEEIISELMKMGLNSVYNFYPKSLSGGMARRVAIIRAMLFNGDVMLLDEPFSSLDISLKSYLIRKIKEYQKESGKTVIFVTHDIGEALSLADRIAVISDGKIIKDVKSVKKDTEKELFDTLMSLGEYE